jgi:glycosyltransferase involved in cell wall biosynthesis
MLAGEDGTVAKELRKLIAWIQDNARPDAILLSLALQAGLAGPLRRALDVPVIGFLQGEDVFLDTLSEPWRRLCWRTLSEQARHASPWVAPSAFYANYMGARMGLPEDELRVLPNGITLDGYPAQPKIAAEPDAVTLGYFAFQSRSKGLDVVIDAFLRYRSRPGARKVKLLVGGSVTDAQKSAVASWKAKVAEAGLGGDVVFHDNVSREHKLALLASMDLFTVAPNYPEAFGMYAVEALASGVPLVLPPTGALPEIVNASSGGVVLADGAPETIAAGWDRLIEDRAERTRLAALAHASARRLYGIDRLAESVEALVRGLVRRD